jgi:hypothetical protein
MSTVELQNTKSAPPIKAALGLPEEMDLPSVCRGALTGWPQMARSINTLSDGGLWKGVVAAELTIGGPKQLLAALTVDPAWLMKPFPPVDIYAHTVWLTKRIYEAARGIAVTLNGLQTLVESSDKMTAAERGAVVAAVLSGPHGLAGRAGEAAAHSQGLANRLAKFESDFKAAGDTVRDRSADVKDKITQLAAEHIRPSIYSQAAVATSAEHIRQSLSAMEMQASELNIYAVLDNLRQAMAAMAAAWRATQTQFQAAAVEDAAHLGDIVHLEKNLAIKAAVSDWTAFVNFVQGFLQRILVVH